MFLQMVFQHESTVTNGAHKVSLPCVSFDVAIEFTLEVKNLITIRTRVFEELAPVTKGVNICNERRHFGI